MSAQFKVGDICVGQNLIYCPEINGMECTIVEGLEMRKWVLDNGEKGESLTYVVIWSDGERTAQAPHELRRKQPPKREIDTVVSWKNCAWQPAGVPA